MRSSSHAHCNALVPYLGPCDVNVKAAGESFLTPSHVGKVKFLFTAMFAYFHHATFAYENRRV